MQLINLGVGTGPERVCRDVTDLNYANGALLQVWQCSKRWSIS